MDDQHQPVELEQVGEPLPPPGELPPGQLGLDLGRGSEPAGKPAKPTPTRASGFWVATVAGLAVLVVLIVFILQNTKDVTISLFTARWHLPLGVALLLAAVIGGIVVALAGAARILELRRGARRSSDGAPGGRRARRRR